MLEHKLVLTGAWLERRCLLHRGDIHAYTVEESSNLVGYIAQFRSSELCRWFREEHP